MSEEELALATVLCLYIRNTAQVPLRADDFDDDWCPAGGYYRALLTRELLVRIIDPVPPTDEAEGAGGGIYLTPAGEALCG